MLHSAPPSLGPSGTFALVLGWAFCGPWGATALYLLYMLWLELGGLYGTVL